MANDRIGQIEDRLNRQVADRNVQIDDLRNQLVEVAAKLRESVAGDIALARRIENLERVPVPSVLSIWGPAVATAALLAGGFAFILEQRDKPILNDIATTQSDIAEVDSELEKIRDRQFDINRELGELGTGAEATQKHLNAVDTRGARRWVEGEKR